MFAQLKAFVRRIDAWGDRTQNEFSHKLFYSEKFTDVLKLIAICGSVWAIGWYAHIIFPWLEHLLGLGPYDIDSLAKIRWRRIYSTALCAPPMLYVIVRYAYNQCKKRR